MVLLVMEGPELGMSRVISTFCSTGVPQNAKLSRKIPRSEGPASPNGNSREQIAARKAAIDAPIHAQIFIHG